MEEDQFPCVANAGLVGVVVGRLVSDVGPVVQYPGSAPVAARTTAALTPADVGAEVALLFEGGDPARPIVIGRLVHPPVAQATVDDQRVVLTGEREVTLRCGKASITLTREGKVLIKGTYISSHSTGVHRVKGGSVQIN